MGIELKNNVEIKLTRFSRFSGKYIASFQGFQSDNISYTALHLSYSEFFEKEIHVRKFNQYKQYIF